MIPYSALIIEDDPQFSSAFADAVSWVADLHLAGVAEDLPEGLHLLGPSEPDVLRVDIAWSQQSQVTYRVVEVICLQPIIV